MTPDTPPSVPPGVRSSRDEDGQSNGDEDEAVGGDEDDAADRGVGAAAGGNIGDAVDDDHDAAAMTTTMRPR